MITITHPRHASITVLGHAVRYTSDFLTSHYDMRDPNWREDIRRNFGEKDSSYENGYVPYNLADYYNGDEKDYAELSVPLYIEYLIDHALVVNSDWGDNETAFDTVDLSCANNRILLAMNGRLLDELADDENAEVAAIVARYGTERHKDKLINHHLWLVRQAIICDPKGCDTKYLDILLKRGEPADLVTIAKNYLDYTKEHINVFTSHYSRQVRALVAQKYAA